MGFPNQCSRETGCGTFLSERLGISEAKSDLSNKITWHADVIAFLQQLNFGEASRGK